MVLSKAVCQRVMTLIWKRVLKRSRSSISRAIAFVLWGLLGLALTLMLLVNSGTSAVAHIPEWFSLEQQAQQGRDQYEAGHFLAAVAIWQNVLNNYRQQEDILGQASTLSNLALAYQQLGLWSDATQAIAESLTLLKSEAMQERSDRLPVLAQALNTQGSLQLALGRPEEALVTWQEAAATYTQAEDLLGVARSQINQAQAMQTLGLYRRALEMLTEVSQTLQTQPDSRLKAAAFRSLGNALGLTGDFGQAQSVLEQSLAIAQRLQSSEDISATLLSLGNTAHSQRDNQAASVYYQQAAATPASLSTQTQAQLAQLGVLIEMEQWAAAQALVPEIQSQINQLPANRTTIYAQLSFAQSLLRLGLGNWGVGTGEPATPYTANPTPYTEAVHLFSIAIQNARRLGDQRAEAYALGSLGQMYEQAQQWSDAEQVTKQALLLAQMINAPDIAYRWQWQLGRLLKTRRDRDGAIAAYSEAVSTLQSLRGDLVAINPEVQFSFRDSVEPVYRELVSLLLEPGNGSDVSQQDLIKARDVLESLQLAELDNFFREACLNAQPTQIDQIDAQAAVIYPIILGDRLEVILSLPQQPLRHYATPIPQDELEKTVLELRYTLVLRTTRDFLAPSQSLYNWLLRPAATELAANNIKTLVFVLDGVLRNVPMAALHTGEQYLIEQFGVAQTPGLQLLSSEQLQQVELKVLAAGLTQPRQGFSPLSNVAMELEEINTEVPSVILLNQAFTSQGLEQAIKLSSFPIVHIATHGQFSSDVNETFLLTWDSRIDIEQLNAILQPRTLNRSTPIELLVLSACKTAIGDKRAALGMAGLAVRAGVRSTIATLWSIDDEATAVFMNHLYEALTQPNITKAQALRQAQLLFLQEPLYEHPIYWSSYVLIGNWL